MTSESPSEKCETGAAGSSKRAQPEALSRQLRRQMDDLSELYADARTNDDPVRMEKLSKSIAALAKQILAHETYERETLSRDDLKRYFRDFAVIVANEARSEFADMPERACRFITAYAAKIKDLAESNYDD